MNLADLYGLNQGSLQLLSDNSVATAHRLKLCRILWVSSSYNPPQKYQKLLNWICQQLSLTDQRSEDVIKLLKTMTEFLNSSHLLESLKQQSRISIRPSIFQTLTSHLNEGPTENILSLIIEVDNILISRKFFTGILTHFTIFSTTLTTWIEFVIKVLREGESQIRTNTISHVSLLISECKSFFRAHSLHRQTFSMFCEKTVPPLLKLHYKCSVYSHPTSEITGLSNTIEQVIIFLLFRRENFQFPEDFGSNFESEEKEKSRRSKKMEQLKYSQNMILSLSKSDSDNENSSLPAHRLSVFMKLCLKYSRMEFSLKVNMFQSLTRLCVKDPGRCTTIASCSIFDTMIFQSLLEVALKEHLYQPVLDRNLKEPLLSFLKDVLTTLLKQEKYNFNWIQCIICLGKIDKSIIESNLKSILLKSIRECAGKVYESLDQLIHCIVDGYVKDRHTTRLVNVIGIVAEGAVSGNMNLELQDLQAAFELFGKTFGSRMRYELSGDLIMKILSAVTAKISEKIRGLADESTSTGCMECINLFLLFFSKILEQAPILMLWDHLSVRKELVQLLKDLSSALTMLAKSHSKRKRNNNTILAPCFMRFTALLSMLQQQLTQYAIKLDEEVKNSFQSIELEKYQDMIEDMYPAFSTDTACVFLRLIMSRLENRMASFCTNDKNDIETHTHNAMSIWLWKQVEKTIDDGNFTSITKGISTQETADTPCFRYFTTLTAFTPTILKTPSDKIKMWLCNTLLHLVCYVESLQGSVKEKVIELFVIIREIGGAEFYASLIRQIANVYSASIGTMLGISFESFSLKRKYLSKFAKAKFPEKDFEDCQRELNRYFFILEQFNIRSLSLDDTQCLYQILVYMALVCCQLLEANSSNEMLETLGRNVSLLLRCAENNQSILSNRDAIPGIAKIKSYVSSEYEGQMAFLIRDIIIKSYATAPDEAYSKLKKVSEGKRRFINVEIQLDVMAQHINALHYLMSSGDHKNKVVAVYSGNESRKRKLRTTEQTRKLMKVDDNFERCGNPIQQVIREDLAKLYEESGQVLKTVPSNTDVALYLQQARMNCIDLLEPESHFLADGQATFNAAFDEMLTATTPKVASIKYLKTCLRCKEIRYDYNYDHLKILISHADSACPTTKPNIEECALQLVARMPLNYLHEELLKQVYQNIDQESNVEEAETFITLANFILKPACLEFLFVQDTTKSTRKTGHVFTKNLLRMVQIYLKRNLRSNTASKTSSLVQANEVLSSLLKLKWANFELFEIANTLCLLHAVPLENIFETGEGDVFVRLFESYVDILHDIILTRDSVGNIISLCLASFRRLLKAALHAAEQRGKDRAARDTLIANKCAGLLEKLFQLAADRYKTQFLKCVSYVVADYVCLVSSLTIIPSTRKSFTGAVYHLLSVMDEYDVAMIRKALPNDMRDQFQSLYLGFKRKFKYKGFV